MIAYTTHETVSHVLTQEGAQIALEGSHESRVWAALPSKGVGSPITPKQLEQMLGAETSKVGQSRAFRNKWIGKEGDGLVKLVCHIISRHAICMCDAVFLGSRD